MNPVGIHHVAAEDPDRPAIIHPGGVLTFGELEARVNGAVGSLIDAGVGRGGVVGSVLGNRSEHFVLLNAAGRLGANLMPLSGRLTDDERRYIIGDSGASVVVVEDPSVDVGAAALWCVDGPQLTTEAQGPPVRDYLGVMPMALQYTSGTTGRPKGVLRRPPEPSEEPQPNLAGLVFGYDRDDIHLVCGPLYHAAPGAHAEMNLWAGGAIVLPSRFDASDALALIDEHRVTSSFMAPAHFVRILEADWEAYDRSSVRRIWHAGAPCPPAIKVRMFDVFPGAIWEFYGMSEGLGGVVSPEEWQERPGTVGRAFPGLAYRILDEDGSPVPVGEIGLVYVASMPGQEFAYRGDPEKTAAAFRDGYYSVGDMGSLDSDGYLFLADRRVDLIIRNGVNIYPAEVERALAEHPEVIDAAVVGLPDDRTGQRVHAIVEARSEDADELLAFLGTRLADFKLPSTIEFVDRLPREPNGKVLKRRLREERMSGDGT